MSFQEIVQARGDHLTLTGEEETATFEEFDKETEKQRREEETAEIELGKKVYECVSNLKTLIKQDPNLISTKGKMIATEKLFPVLPWEYQEIFDYAIKIINRENVSKNPYFFEGHATPQLVFLRIREGPSYCCKCCDERKKQVEYAWIEIQRGLSMLDAKFEEEEHLPFYYPF